MHENAENGICAHWAYKEKIDLKKREKKFAWVGQLRDWQREIFESKEFLEGLKIDFFKNRIFVFTPMGDVIDLPEGATSIDFAYHIHTEVGNHCSGAKINGKMAPLSNVLKNGDVVEIIIDKNKFPSRDWLKFVKTNLARSHIKKEVKGGFLEVIGEKISPKRLVKRFLEEREKLIPSSKRVSPGVAIGGKTDISFVLARCCNPKPGDKIVAYVTKDKRASIHNISCSNLKKIQSKWPQKILEASWLL
jgi:GTP pyrophosphokinase